MDPVFELLSTGEMEILGLLPYATNATLLTRVSARDGEALAVYKPRRGERPLWDFPDGTLCLREYAAWVVDRELGWNLVPPTVLRDGPAGFGAVQLFIDEDVEIDVRALVRTHLDDLRRIATFDLVINNGDRKAGHLIVDTAGKLWGVDHGVCFADEPKLRTVVWAFEGEPIPEQLLRDVANLRGITEMLDELLSPAEIVAFDRRVEVLLRTGCFPAPGPGRRPVPWPPW